VRADDAGRPATVRGSRHRPRWRTARRASFPLPVWLAAGAAGTGSRCWSIYWILRLPPGLRHRIGLARSDCCMDVTRGRPARAPRARAVRCRVRSVAAAAKDVALQPAAADAAGVRAVRQRTRFSVSWVQTLAGHRDARASIFLMGSLTSAFCWPLIRARRAPRERSLHDWRVVALSPRRGRATEQP
jgi:hypothetical protein